MSHMKTMVQDTAARLFQQAFPYPAIQALASDSYDRDLWTRFEDAGFGSLLSLARQTAGAPEADPEEAADAADATLALLHAAGYQHVPLPIADTLVARALAASAGLDASDGISTCIEAPLHATAAPGGEYALSGEARHVPWARHAARILVVTETKGVRAAGWLPLDAPGVHIAPGRNLAGEPRDDVRLDGVRMRLDPLSGPTLLELRALSTAALIAGAAEAALDLTVHYAGERVQFGKPIFSFQAVQQQIAVLAGEVASARAACALAFAHPVGEDWRRVAIAKMRAGVAASVAAEIAHQVHGAIGITQEYPLHLLTRRLWSWRTEGGAETLWAERLGREVIARGGDRLWPDLVALQPEAASA